MHKIFRTLALFSIVGLLFGIVIERCSPHLYKATVVIGTPLAADPYQLTQALPAQVQVSLLRSISDYYERVSARTLPPETQRYRTLLSSTRIAAAVMARAHPEYHIFRDELDANGRWHPPQSVAGFLIYVVDLVAGQQAGWSPPDPVRLANYIENHVGFTLVENGRGLRVDYWDEDAVFAKQFIDLLVGETHRVMQQDADEHNARMVSSLENALAGAKSLEIRQSLIQEVDHQNLIRSLSATAQIGYQVIDPPSVTADVTDENPFIVISLFLLSGAYLGILFLLVRRSINSAEIPS